MEGSSRIGLFVDLDGTLVATDVLWEAFIRALKQQPWIVFMLPLWLLRGRAGLKRALSRRVAVDPDALPYNDEVVSFVRERHEAGYKVVLATATDKPWADSVADRLGLFDDVLASDGTTNLKGSGKLAAIEAYCKEHRLEQWSYMGDASADLPIWAKSEEIFVVAPTSGLLTRVKAIRAPTRVFGMKGGKLKPAIKAMRPHQWVKNALLFVPLLLAREFGNPHLLLSVVAAVASFSLCASAVYLLNDMLDIEADRLHPRKRKRPFASGSLPLAYAPPMAVVLTLTAFAVAYALLPTAYLGVLALYMVATSLYSTIFKSKLLVDVFLLAGLYTLRIFAGGVAAELRVSEWLLAFSIFMFTSLAFAKRYVEMSRLAAEGKTTAHGRGYQVGDLSLIESIGPTSGYLAVLVFALYINNGLPAFYTNTTLLWLTCPLLLYWITRLWFLAKRNELSDDPVVFAVTDKVSLGIGAAVGTMVVLAATLG